LSVAFSADSLKFASASDDKTVTIYDAFNACVLQPCSDHGSCVDQVKAFNCNCDAGYSGSKCETNINECAGQTCSRHGDCVDGVNEFTCTCDAGWTGTTCQTYIREMNECASQNSCSNHGECVGKDENRFTCKCFIGWKGTVRVFRQKFTLEDAIGSHACSLEANTRVTNGIPLGSSLFLPVDTVNCVQTLKAPCVTCVIKSRAIIGAHARMVGTCSLATVLLVGGETPAKATLMPALTRTVGMASALMITTQSFADVTADGKVQIARRTQMIALATIVLSMLHESTGWLRTRANAIRGGVVRIVKSPVNALLVPTVRCAFSTEIYTRGCHWSPRQLA
jgi:hypothetical protein